MQEKKAKGRKVMKNEHGFTLIELVVIVAIIAIIAAIAIPNLHSARMVANEAGAIAGLRAISSAQVVYLTVNYGNLGTLAQLINDNYLDSRYSAAFNGYQYSEGAIIGRVPGPPALKSSAFDVEPGGANGFIAIPVVVNSTGRYTYGMGNDYVIRYMDGVPVPKCGAVECNVGDPVGLMAPS